MLIDLFFRLFQRIRSYWACFDMVNDRRAQRVHICILRKGHESPWHESRDGHQWTSIRTLSGPRS